MANARNQGGRTPLSIASIVGHKEIVDLLIANGGKSDKGKENLEDRHLMKRRIIKERNQARNSLPSPQNGDEAFFSQTAGLGK